MWQSIVCVLGFGIAAPVEPVAGSWRVEGNGFVGELIFKLADGKIDGTIYNQPIVGTYDTATKAIKFTRKVVVRSDAPTPVQEWSGTVKTDAATGQSTIAGSYKSVAGPDWGADNHDYPFEAARLTTPAEELKALQGRWALESSNFDVNSPAAKADFPAVIVGLGEAGSRIAFAGNRLTTKGEVIPFANDLDLPPVRCRQSRDGHRPFVMALPSGKGVLASYKLDGNSVSIHCPPGCCSRSGAVVAFKRVAE